MKPLEKAQFISNWIKDYVEKMPSKAQSLIIGISGGIDSSVSSTLSAMTGIKTIVLSMPIKQKSSQHDLSLKHQEWLVKNFNNVEAHTLNLDKLFETFESTLSNFDSELGMANSRARIRMTTLYQVAAANKGIVVGTGNKVEDFGVGFYTKYGDGGVDISPIADCNKSEVWEIGKSINILQKIIDASGFVYTTTSLGKTVLDEKGNKFIGTYSDAASIDNVTNYVNASDCFLTLGTLITDDYLWFVENKFSDMIMATTTEIRVGYYTYKDVTMKDFMEALLQRFENSNCYPLDVKAPEQPKYPEPWVSSSDSKYNDTPEVITYNRFFQHTVKYIEDNNMWNDINLTFGVSSAMYVATNIYGMKQNSFISSAAWQCIGYETGAALGAQLGSKKQSWTIAGDGGFMMICQSLSTLAKYNVNSVIFVMSNQVYAIEQVFVDVDAFCPNGKFDEFDYLPKWDYMALSKAYGANGLQANTIKELNTVLETLKTTKTNKPTLVEISIPEKDLAGQMRNLTPQVMNCNK